MKVAGPDVRKLGDILHAAGREGQRRQRRDPRPGPHGRADRPPDRRAPARHLRALADRLLARGDLLRTHRRDGRPVMTRLIRCRVLQAAQHAHVLRPRRRLARARAGDRRSP